MYNAKAEHRRISYLVYLNGIEIPCEAVTVTNSVWAFPTASLQFPPDRLLRRIGYEDRMRATVFYLDTWRADLEKSDAQWRLLFDGEVTDHSYTNSPQGRSIVLNCADLASSLSQMKMFFLMSIANIVQKVTELAPVEVHGTAYRPIFPASLFFRGFVQHDGNEMRRPFDFIDNAMRALFGDVDVDPFALQAVQEQNPDATPQSLKSTVGAHFFGKWARKVNFHRRWIPMPIFEEAYVPDPDATEEEKDIGVFPVLRALKSQQAIAAINHTAGRIGDNGSVWDMMQAIFQQMYYEVGLISTPSAVKVDRKTGAVIGPYDNEVKFVKPAKKTPEIESSLDADPTLSASRDFGGRSLSPEDQSEEFRLNEQEARQQSLQPQELVTGVELRLTSYVTKPQLIFAVPPACNVVWHSMVMRHQYNENYRTQPTRLVISEGNLFNTILGDKQDRNLMEYINLIQAVGFPKEAQQGLDLRLGRNGKTPNPLVNPHNHIVFPEEFFKGPVYINRSIPPWFMYLSLSQGDPEKNQASTKAFVAVGEELIEWAESERKVMAGFAKPRPASGITDTVVEFVAGPSSPTGEQINAQAALGKLEEYIAKLKKELEPLTPDDGNILPSADARSIFQWVENVTKAESLSKEYNLALSEERVNKLLERLRPTSAAEDTISSQYVYRLYAKYEFYRAKYGKRNGASVMIFNPYIVPAYPMVIWDDEETQYHTFAYAVTVTHSLTAQSAQTTVNYSFGRTFEEFYSELVATRQVQKDNDARLQPEANEQAIRRTQEELIESGEAEGRLSLFEQEAQDEQNELISPDVSPVDQQAARDKQIRKKARELAITLVKLPYDSVPVNPIADVRTSFQQNLNATAIYTDLFWRGGRLGLRNAPKKDAEFPAGELRKPIFDVWDMVEIYDERKEDGKPKKIPQGGKPDFQSLEVGFVPAEAYKHFAENPDQAMQFVSRPICTLHEWIEMQREKGIPITEDNVIPADDPRQGKGAPYAAKILNLTPGPGRRPPMSEAGNLYSTLEADTRRDWESILLRLRQKFYHEDEPKLA